MCGGNEDASAAKTGKGGGIRRQQSSTLVQVIKPNGFAPKREQESQNSVSL